MVRTTKLLVTALPAGTPLNYDRMVKGSEPSSGCPAPHLVFDLPMTTLHVI